MNCQLPESVALYTTEPLELPPPHDESVIVPAKVPASNKSHRLCARTPQNRALQNHVLQNNALQNHALQNAGESGSRFGPHIARVFVNVSMTFRVLEA